MNKEKLQFCHPLRVRYAEVDAQGIVFNAHYLTYFDTSLTEFMRHIGITFTPANITALEYDYHLVKATVEFHGRVNFDDELEIYVGIGRIGNSSLTFKLYLYRKDEDALLTSGEIIWVHANQQTHQSAPLPPEIIEKLTPFLIDAG